MNICVSRPITGLGYDEVTNSYTHLRDVFLDFGYSHVYYAFTGRSHLKDEKDFAAEGYTHPLSSNHAITLGDRWMCKQGDVMYLRLLGAKTVSIGCMMELAWAFDNGKHVVISMERDNVHRHAFVLECAHVVWETEEEALDYLRKLARGEV